MRPSRPAVHPVEAPPPQTQGENADAAPVGVRMKDTQGGPGTPGGLGLRLVQVFFAAASLAAMASTNDFPSVTAFWCDTNLATIFLIFFFRLLSWLF
jgi:hypothetical protein